MRPVDVCVCCCCYYYFAVAEQAKRIYDSIVVRNNLVSGRRPLSIVAAVIAIAIEAADGLEAGAYIEETARCLGTPAGGVRQRHAEICAFVLSLARTELGADCPEGSFGSTLRLVLDVCSLVSCVCVYGPAFSPSSLCCLLV